MDRLGTDGACMRSPPAGVLPALEECAHYVNSNNPYVCVSVVMPAERPADFT